MTGEHGRAAAGHRRLRQRKETPQRSAGLNVESLTKMLGAGALMAYAAGLLVVNAYLLEFEVSDFELFRARFVLTGTLVLSVVAFATVFPLAAAVVVFRTWQKSAASRWSSRLTDTAVAAMLACVPMAIYCFGLAQSVGEGLSLYFSAGVLGGLVLLAVYFVRNPPDPDNRDANRLPAWTFFPLLSIFVIPYVIIVVGGFATDVYPDVPEQLGGARPSTVTLLVDRDAIPSVRALGLGVADDGSAHVRLLFHGEGFYVVELVPEGSVVLRSDVVLGVARP